MKLARFSNGDAPRVGAIAGDGIYDVPARVPGAPKCMLEFISRWQEFSGPLRELVAGRAPDLALDDVKLLAPVRRPRKIFAIGLNYADHCAESGLEIPTEQTWFAKVVTETTGPFDPVELPAASEQLDHECELVAVIGKRCRNVPRERAREVIFGYCAGNDLSVRDWQLRTTQWVIGKSFDTHAAIGPWITTGDEVDPGNLDIRCLVNGEERQHSNTRHLVFKCEDQVAYLSRAVTLEPGDLLFTGTCGGVGAVRKPPVWLKAGDVVRVEIGGLGAIENRVIAGSAATLIT